MPDTVQSVNVILPQTTLTVGMSMMVSANLITNVPDNQVNQQPLVWSSSNPAVATVIADASSAVVRAVGVGDTQIKVRVGSIEGIASLAVSLPVIDITAAQETAIKSLPVPGRCQLRGPTTVFDVQVSG